MSATGSNRLTYGPFRLRVDLLGASIAALFGSLLLMLAGTRTTYIQCARAQAVRCELEERPFGATSRPFDMVGVRATRERRSAKGKRSYEVGRVVLLDSHGRDHPSVEVEADVARDDAARIQSFLEDTTAYSFEHSVGGPWWTIALGAAGAILGAVTMRAALRGAGRVHLELSQDGATLLARRTFLGLPLARKRIDIRGATAVELEWQDMPDPLRRTFGPKEVGGRLRVRTESESVPLLETFGRGRNVHVQAAKRLRELLGIGEPSVDPPVPALGAHYDWGSRSGRFMAYWMGAWVGMACGAGLFVVTLVLFGREGPWDRGAEFFGLGSVGLGAALGIAVAHHSIRRA